VSDTRSPHVLSHTPRTLSAPAPAVSSTAAFKMIVDAYEAMDVTAAYACRVSPDGRQLAVSGFDCQSGGQDGGRCKVFFNTHKMEKDIPAKAPSTLCVAPIPSVMSPHSAIAWIPTRNPSDLSRYFMASIDQEIFTIDIQSAEKEKAPFYRFDAKEGHIDGLSVRDEYQFVTSHRGKIILWNQFHVSGAPMNADGSLPLPQPAAVLFTHRFAAERSLWDPCSWFRNAYLDVNFTEPNSLEWQRQGSVEAGTLALAPLMPDKIQAYLRMIISVLEASRVVADATSLVCQYAFFRPAASVSDQDHAVVSDPPLRRILG
jgi:hypothetical protein